MTGYEHMDSLLDMYLAKKVCREKYVASITTLGGQNRADYPAYKVLDFSGNRRQELGLT